LNGLKAKITFVIVPVKAVKFVQKILKYDNAVDVLYYGTAISPAAALMVFDFMSIRENRLERLGKKVDDESETRVTDLKNKGV
jgi:hypothetical protein